MSEGAAPASFGRVDPDGTVYVRTETGERSVGQVPGVPAEEALTFFTRRFQSLELEVSLLETRIASQTVSPRMRLPRSRRCGQQSARRTPSAIWTV